MRALFYVKFWVLKLGEFFGITAYVLKIKDVCMFSYIFYKNSFTGTNLIYNKCSVQKIYCTGNHYTNWNSQNPCPDDISYHAPLYGMCFVCCTDTHNSCRYNVSCAQRHTKMRSKQNNGSCRCLCSKAVNRFELDNFAAHCTDYFPSS